MAEFETFSRYVVKDPDARSTVDDETCSSSSDQGGISSSSCSSEAGVTNNCEYHIAEGAKVVGVHKQERRKSIYLFVIIVRWSDKSQVTIYRKWKEIKKLRHELLNVAKNSERCSDSRRYLKKTGHRAARLARFHQGTMQSLNMIDSLNQYFEAVLHFKDLAENTITRKFFKPNEKDLTALSWSGDGRTYFYVSRDILGERNTAFDTEDDFGIGLEMDDVFLKPTIRIETEDQKKIGGDFNDAMDKYCEADPGISWPIASNIHVAICNYEPSGDDISQHVIKIQEGEEFEVLDQNESGWWLVSRISDGTGEVTDCGYVSASFLKPKNRQGSFSQHRDNCPERNSKQSRLDPLDEEDSAYEENENQSPEASSTPSTSSLESLSPQRSEPTNPRRGTVAAIDCTHIGTSFSALDEPNSCPSPARLRSYSTGIKDAGAQAKLGPNSRDTNFFSCFNIPGTVSNSLVNYSALSHNSSLLSIGVDYISMKEYNAENTDEISFPEGAIISVILRKSNGWWTASYQGRTGLVPGVNLKRYRDPIRGLGLHVFSML